MKNALLLIVIALMFACPSVSHSEEQWKSVCESVATLAETVIAKKYEGMSMSKMMSVIGENDDADREIVADAFEMPRYSTEEMIKKQKEEFRDKWYLRCYKSYLLTTKSKL